MHTIGLPRTCLGFTNLFCLLTTFVCFGVCVWCAINTEFFKAVNFTITKSAIVGVIADFLNLKLWYIPLTSVFIPVAVLGMLTSCCGILSAGCKMKCAIKSYIFFMTLLSCVAFWIVFVTGIYNIYTDNAKMQRYLQKNLRSYYGKDNDAVTFLFDYVMVNYECCGVVGYTDFTASNWKINNTDIQFPIQCCRLSNKTALIPVYDECPIGELSGLYSYKNMGCFKALRKSITNNKASIITYIVMLSIFYSVIVLFAYTLLKGEPLIHSLSDRFVTMLPSRNTEVLKAPSESSLQNMMFAEPPKRVMRVVSAVNPSRTYQTLQPRQYSDYIHSDDNRRHTNLK